jgi:excisionase family DNA binding protein
MTIQMKNEKEFYTVEQLATLLSITERTVLESIRKAEIKAYKRFKKWYVLHTDVLDFLYNSETNQNQNK